MPNRDNRVDAQTLRCGRISERVDYRTLFSGRHDVDRFIAQANIDEFKRLLKTEKDHAKRNVLLQLLADEEQKLAAASPADRKRASSSEQTEPSKPSFDPPPSH
jgi:hypothetical protein